MSSGLTTTHTHTQNHIHDHVKSSTSHILATRPSFPQSCTAALEVCLSRSVIRGLHYGLVSGYLKKGGILATDLGKGTLRVPLFWPLSMFIFYFSDNPPLRALTVHFFARPRCRSLANRAKTAPRGEGFRHMLTG
eukprot:4741789-Amphidinium_carterae.1